MRAGNTSQTRVFKQHLLQSWLTRLIPHARRIDVCMARTHASSHTRKNTHLTTINSLQSVPRIDASAQVRRTAWLYAPDSDTLTTVISIEGHTQTAGPAGTKVARDTEVYTHLLYL